MRNIVLFNVNSPPKSSIYRGVFKMDDIAIGCGMVCTEQLAFDRLDPKNAARVLVKVKAFSCNYRDKLFIFSMLKKGVGNSFFAVGSDFVGEVVDTGPEVEQIKIKDRVIGNNNYVGFQLSAAHFSQGIPTSHASKEYHTFHESQLVTIPPEMPDEIAAAFSVGAQTAYSMVRKLEIKPRSNVLITAARSNTALFIINALKPYDVNIIALSTSAHFEQELKHLGVRELIPIDLSIDTFARNKRIGEICAEYGRFDYVFDPFFDIYIDKVIDILSPGGKYITCGLGDQYHSIIEQDFQHAKPDVKKLFLAAIMNNLHIYGNCLGLTGDLKTALQDYQAGVFNAIIDSTHTNEQIDVFFERTYSAKDRFGKVVYHYD